MFYESSRMRFLTRAACLCPLLLTAAQGTAPVEETSFITTEPPNANHIFNAIHSSMRQWGSSVNHNGMSFFLASVPEGTQLYHGTSTSQPVSGTEWLAFEPEHAMGFARPHRSGHRPGPPSVPSRRLRDQIPLKGGSRQDSTEDAPEPGYLHTYAAAKDLRLLYLDGMAAGKTDKGTLEAQDLILLNNSFPPGGGSGERERADHACQIATETWGGRINGFLRMEAGFEIILCSFERDLRAVRITQAKQSGPDEGRGRKGGPGSMGWLQAIAARYHGIGGNRVSVNFDQFVTAYTYDLDLFPGNDTLPRLGHLPPELLEPIRKDLSSLVLSHDALETSFDWQAVTDMIIARYSDELQFLVSGRITSTSSLHLELERLLQPFIDYSEDKNYLVIDRCSKQFIPFRNHSDTLASRAVQSISRHICSTLFSALDIDLQTAIARIGDLVRYLSWTTWKECRGCEYGEICVIPMWPMGTVDDYEHPICQAIDQPLRSGESYWGGFPHGPPS